MKYSCGVNIISHRFEWQSSGGGWKPLSPALRSTDYKCPHCLMIEYNL